VALLLWGVHMVQSGVQRAFGARLRVLLGRALKGRLSAALAGLGVTTVLQSSTATGLMVTGFVGGGLVGLAPALAVMLGANIGTTLIVQLLSFNIYVVAPASVLAGLVVFRREGASYRDFGRVFIGLGLILIALHEFSSLLQPVLTTPLVRQALSQLSGHIIFIVLATAMLAWAAHSSAAVVLLGMSLAAQGVIPAPTALAFVLGANLGSSINPVLEAASGAGGDARRLPLGNLLVRAVGVLAILAGFHEIAALVSRLEPTPARAVADFHTAFNLALALLVFPWVGAYAALLERLIPSAPVTADPARPLYLDPAARDPAVALGGAAREALRMADVLEAMLRGFRAALETVDRREVADIQRADDVLDKLNHAIKAYVASLDQERLTGGDHRRSTRILAFATSLEQAGDVVDKGLLRLVGKLAKRDLVFSAENQAALLTLTERLIANVRAAAALFVSSEERGARLLVREKEAFREFEAEASTRHFAELRSGALPTVETSALFLDALGDLKRVNAYLVEAAAYPVLEARGDLLPTRLRDVATAVD
jgi:phosphate:Na+ symporter